MSMTFLQLASRLRQEVGGSGTGPTSIANQVGEYARFCSWIIEADEEIQRKYNQWRFMVGSFTLNTVADDGSYAASDCITPVTDLREWRLHTFKIYLLSGGVGGEVPLNFIDYDRWYSLYNTGTQGSGFPVHFTVGNDRSIKLGQLPNGIYRISGEYQKSVTSLSGASDTPSYPAEYHMLPVYVGMMRHGRFVGASEIYQEGKRLSTNMMAEMMRTQLPRIKRAGPLA